MELVIFWSQLAEDKLYDIFSYYKLKAGVKIAQNIVTQIINKTDYLKKQPRIGALEELLIDRMQEFRYLVSTIKSYTILITVPTGL